MRTIWKYAVRPGRFLVEMPHGAAVLDVQPQGDDPVMWVLVDTDAPIESYWFHVAGTGHELPDDIDIVGHLGTWQADGLVWHLFEVLR